VAWICDRSLPVSIVSCYAYTVACVEVKMEADSDDITECPHDDMTFTGMFGSPYKCVLDYLHHVQKKSLQNCRHNLDIEP